MRNEFIAGSVLLVLVTFLAGYFWQSWFFWLFLFIGPIIILGIYDMFQKKHSIMRNFPILGRARYVAEWFRPKVYQYFIESDTDGKPFSRMFRSIIYQRAKQVLDTAPFGTQLDLYKEGYEWMNHSIAPFDHHKLTKNPRRKIGSSSCKLPYEASLFNISALSFGSLSKNAILALNGGAAIGNFAHNTGEGGISPYHNAYNGDLIYQIGTGYFGCRDEKGNFSETLFEERVMLKNVKMIELKLSQGAKPGHGGILPAKKVSLEIAKIRNIEAYKEVISPPNHTAFSSPMELMEFIARMRKLSKGKPVGFKFCPGYKTEFLAICKAMIETSVFPDFITVDGGEGGTGAAPLEFSNSVGMPFMEGLAFVYNALIGFDLKKEISLLASGKIVTGFHIFRAMALGADACYSARAMMMALGCIQALECNKNTCPVGVTSQNPELVKGLVVSDKKQRVANYHRETVESFVELLAAAGLDNPDQINRSHVSRRTSPDKSMSYEEIYPYIPKGSLLEDNLIPESWRGIIKMANPKSFLPHYDQIYTE